MFVTSGLAFPGVGVIWNCPCPVAPSLFGKPIHYMLNESLIGPGSRKRRLQIRIDYVTEVTSHCCRDHGSFGSELDTIRF